MCGLTGIAGRPGLDPERSQTVRKMTATLLHRGPDGEGYAERDGCDLGFRRLSIVDVGACSPPLGNEDGSVWSVCNGEIYNYTALRKIVEDRGHRLETLVDTEVLPHLYEEFGPDFVEQLDGMFAFAIWDEKRRRLMLGRDRAGEKPLFYWHGEEEFVFASELRALLANPAVPRALDPIALRRYLLHDFYPAPAAPIHGVRKLPAGCTLLLQDGRATTHSYWDLADYFGEGDAAMDDPAMVVPELDRRIGLAVSRRKRSDVPVGVFLSGGIDSSTILAHLAEQDGPGVPVFALGHTESSFDEARYARGTAAFFDADYNELVLGQSELEEGLRRIGSGMDEPLGDASTIPTHLLAMLARQKVKVILSGEGGDELFAGYPTYLGNRLANAFSRLPRPLRSLLAVVAKGVTPVSMGNVGIDYLIGRFLAGAELHPVERHHSWFGSIAPERHREVLSPAVFESLADDDPFSAARSRLEGRTLPDSLSELLYMDFTMYLQDDLLTKVDRATMLASLEARAPFLDHELVEFVAALPSRMKLRGLTTKAVLRRAVEHRLPPVVLRRRKRGFNIPFSRWLLHGLGERLRQRFSAERVEARGLLSPAGVAGLLDEHLSRRADHRKPLFTLLAFDMWCDMTYGKGGHVPIASPGGAPR